MDMDINIATILPTTLATLTDAGIGAVTAMYAFSRSLGANWDAFTTSLVFNTQDNIHPPMWTTRYSVCD